MIVLPVAALPAGQPPPPEPGEPPRPSTFFQPLPDAPTVLIAEDHVDSLDALRTLLEAFGYRVLVARNGREAVEVALAHQPDLVLMDLMMPVMDGFEATRLLRAAAGFRQVPILAVSAMEGARPEVLAAGCDDLVTKPLDVRAFLDVLRGWVRAGRDAA